MRAPDGIPSLPPEVLAAASACAGGITRIESLGGLSGRIVARVQGTGRSVVAKGPVSTPEVEVARRFPELLLRHGVRVPRVFATPETADDGTWIVMEYLPDPLPQGRWGADEQVIAMLRALHTLPSDAVEDLPGRYLPGWDDALTASAASTLGADDAVVDRLAVLAERAQPLFDPRCVVSGDPNPLNWRVDGEQCPVLLDLERLTVASPALDLAIVLAGLPDRAAAAAVTAAYGSGAPTVDEVLLAKAWSVVELAATAADGTPAHDVVMYVRPAFFSWLEQL